MAKPLPAAVAVAAVAVAAGCAQRALQGDATWDGLCADEDPGGWEVWVANQAIGDRGAVQVIDPERAESDPEGAVVATIDAGFPFPHDVWLAPGLGRAYVACQRDDATSDEVQEGVVEIGVAAREVTARVEMVGDNPHSSRTRPAPGGAERELWVANQGRAHVTVLAVPGLTDPGEVPVVERFSPGGGPTQIAFTPEGARAVVAAGDGTYLIDAGARAPIAGPVEGGRASMGLEVTPDGAWGILTDPVSSKVVAFTIDPFEAGCVWRELRAQPFGAKLHDGGALVTVARDRQIVRLEREPCVRGQEGWELLRAGPAWDLGAATPNLIAVSPTCHRAYLTDPAGRLLVVKVPEGQVVATVDLGGKPHGIDVSR